MGNTASAPSIAVANSVKNLLASSEYSDLTITCGDSSYEVHKAIVCSRSEFFRNAERHHCGEETSRHTIDLSEEEDRIVKLLVQYLYEGEYAPEIVLDGDGDISDGRPEVVVPKIPSYTYDFPHTCSPGCPGPKNSVCPHHQCGLFSCRKACRDFICTRCCKESQKGEADQMTLHAKMYEIGKKYVVEGLEDLAQLKFIQSCNFFWDTPSFVTTVHHIFSSTSEGDTSLREKAVEIMSQHPGIVNKPEVEALLHQFSDLAVALAKCMAKESARKKAST